MSENTNTTAQNTNTAAVAAATNRLVNAAITLALSAKTFGADEMPGFMRDVTENIGHYALELGTLLQNGTADFDADAVDTAIRTNLLTQIAKRAGYTAPDGTVHLINA